MTFSFATTSLRRAKPSHSEWQPRAYMTRAVAHLTSKHSAGLALDPGLGKTSITLEAFRLLKQRGMARTMLVVAPLRVCRQVWRQEGQKWTQFRDLRFSLLHGAKKAERLKDDADIWLINPEGCMWLAQQFWGRPLPYDVVCIDELTKFKNHKSERSKALRPRMTKTRYRWGLTGSLAPNGYLDLFGQQLMLDDGAALGKYVTHYRDQYFTVDYNGFDYDLQPGAEKRIIARIAPYWLQMDADDYLKMPPLFPDPREIDMEPEARRVYERMKKEMIAELPGGVVTAANQGAVYSKLSQMANGFVYLNDQHDVAHIHDGKLDALEELVEELNGRPMLVAYEFNADLDRLRERFGKDLPHLGKGTTPAQETQYIAAWNANKLPILACHPASAGHGLNLQEGSAAHVCWFGVTWDLELYDQFIRRIRRSGNTAQRIFNHILSVRGTIDELKMEALRDKNMTQRHLLVALNHEILRDAEAQSAGVTPSKTETQMTVAKLSRQSDAAAGTAPRTFTPKGWGAPVAAPLPEQPGQATSQESAQRERIAQTLQGNPPQQTGQTTGQVEEGPSRAEQARAMFSKSVQEDMKRLAEHEDGPANAPVPTTLRDPAPEASTAAPPAPRARTRRTTEKPAGEAPGEGLSDLNVRLQILDYSTRVSKDPVSWKQAAKEMYDFVTAA